MGPSLILDMYAIYHCYIRPVISHGEGQCFIETKEVPWALLSALPGLQKSTNLPPGRNSLLAGCIIFIPHLGYLSHSPFCCRTVISRECCNLIGQNRDGIIIISPCNGSVHACTSLFLFHSRQMSLSTHMSFLAMSQQICSSNRSATPSVLVTTALAP